MKKLAQCVILLFTFVFLSGIYPKLEKGQNGSNVIFPLPESFFELQASKPALESSGCPSTLASKNHTFHLNPDARGFELFENAGSEARNKLRGSVSIAPGWIDQGSRIVIHVTVRSTNRMDLDRVALSTSDNALSIDYDYRRTRGPCTEVHTTVYLWPALPQDSLLLNIQTGLFDISILPFVNWRFENVTLRSDHGAISLANTGDTRLIAQKTYIQSIDGHVYGRYTLGDALEVFTNSATVALSLHHARGTSYHAETAVATRSGAVNVYMPFDYWPEHHNVSWETRIGSESGDVWAQVLHGSYTEIRTLGNGSIYANIMPVCADDDSDVRGLYTISETGDVSVSVQNAHLVNCGYNPLSSLFSGHFARRAGNLQLAFADQWFGEMAAISGDQLSFEGSELENVVWEGGLVKARRGKKGDSRMSAGAEGSVYLSLGLGN